MDRKSFYWTQRNLHNLSYNPRMGYKCRQARQLISTFMQDANIILYKGGVVEKEFGEEMGLTTFNLEKFGVKKADNHNPLHEVVNFYNQLQRMYNW